MRFRSTILAVLGLATFAACSERAPITAARSAPGDSGANLARIASVSVTLASSSIAAGSTTQATANVKDVYGNKTSASISWKSSNTAVATVSSTGLVTGVAAGTATISANVYTYYGTKTGSAALTVTSAAAPPPTTTAPGTVTTLAASASSASSVTLTFTQVSNGAGAAANYDVRFAEAPISWGSAASVTNGTCATPLAGTGTTGALSCTVLGLTAGKTYNFQLVAFRGTLNVDAKFGSLSNVASATTPTSSGTQTPTTIAVSPSAASLAVGATQALSAIVKDQSGASMTCSTLSWTSQNTSLVTVSATGAAKGIAAGSTTVTAACGSISANATITVTAAAAVVTSVSVSPPTASIAVGATQALAATVKDQNGATMTGQTITWTSSAPSIASVSGSGVVTGVGAGSATITAATAGKSGTASITVTAPAPPPPPPSGHVDTVFYEGFEANSFSQFQDGYNSQTQHIIADGGAYAGNRYLDVTYTPGQDAGWLTRFFMPGYDSLYVRMRVRFTPGFNGGTKIFGFKGSRTDDQWSAYGNAGVCPNGTDRFAAMVVMDATTNRSGYTAPISFYSYWPEMARESDGVTCWGRRGDGHEHYYPPLDLSTGSWHLVEFWVKLNTIGQHDALQQLWIDGRLAGDWAGQSFRTSTILKLNSLTLTFSSSPTQVQHMYMDEILVAKQKPTP